MERGVLAVRWSVAGETDGTASAGKKKSTNYYFWGIAGEDEQELPSQGALPASKVDEVIDKWTVAHTQVRTRWLYVSAQIKIVLNQC